MHSESVFLGLLVTLLCAGGAAALLYFGFYGPSEEWTVLFIVLGFLLVFGALCGCGCLGLGLMGTNAVGAGDYYDEEGRSSSIRSSKRLEEKKRMAASQSKAPIYY